MLGFYGAPPGHSPYPQGPAQMMPRNAPSGTSSKLRNSCHSCAVSKVKCPKEKPACSKCESRGIPCQYFLARRPGRRVDRSKSLRLASSDDISRNLGIATMFGSDPVTAFPGVLGAPSLEQTSPLACFLPETATTTTKTTTTTPQHSLSRRASYLDSTLDGLDISAPLNGDHAFIHSATGDVFSTLEASPGSNSIHNMPEFDPATTDMDSAMPIIDYAFDMPVLPGADMAQAHGGISSLLLPSSILTPDLLSCEASPILDSLTPSSGDDSFASQSRRNSIMPHPTGYSTTCGCLAQALELLNSASTTVTPSLMSHNHGPETGSITSIHTILNENRNSIAIVAGRLACASCAGDSSLLAILFMIVLRILERYATAALVQSPWTLNSPTPTPITQRRLLKVRSHSIPVLSEQRQRYDGNHFQSSTLSDRVNKQAASQLVLSELFRVQLLIDQLSMQLRSPVTDGGSVHVMDMEFGSWPPAHHEVVGDCPDATMATFSSGTLVQMERDVRQTLNLLSTEIIGCLQKN
ncbi:hypothetical protein BD289DRAFT_484952 [Coniella lustricola]|uniref:Zn(2)-C6 fungal-type domain-containing protein n=1 Tax=Coniella lustricola TaxID=2025994 RepID=A0A2T3A0E0_9PEZI|nr:hypothetical protein BD289DRAFT_484952 [Coniella lustricola]